MVGQDLNRNTWQPQRCMTHWIVFMVAARQKLMLNLSGSVPMNRIPIAPQIYNRALKPFSSATVSSYELSQCCAVPNVHQLAIIKHTQDGGESIFNACMLCISCGSSSFSEYILALSSSWTFTCLKDCLHPFPFPKLPPAEMMPRMLWALQLAQ